MKINYNKYFKEFKILLVLVIVAFTVKNTLIEIYVVPTGSMEDEILVGDLLIGNKFTYGMRTPDWIGIPYTRLGFYIPSLRLPSFKKLDNGDVAMFEFPRDPFQKYVKRCIGIPKDSIEIKKGNIYLNNKLMPFPKKAKYITFFEGDLDSNGVYNRDDFKLINSSNQMRFSVAARKINFVSQNYAIINNGLTFNKKGAILLTPNLQLNPYMDDYTNNNDFKENASIQEQYIYNKVYPYFNGNHDNINSFIVPYKGMRINVDEWFNKHNEWISFITLLVQDGNIVELDGIKFIMEDPESIAQISGILWYKIFPNDEKRRENYHLKKGKLKKINKLKNIDNPWNIYESPFFWPSDLGRTSLRDEKSIDLNQDGLFDENDLVNNVIYKSFIEKYDKSKIRELINEKYDGKSFLFGLDFYKDYADLFIRENLLINGKKIDDFINYKVKHDYYLFIGDNRDNSYDSRIWGFVPDYQILGTPLLSLVNIVKFKLRLRTIN